MNRTCNDCDSLWKKICPDFGNVCNNFEWESVAMQHIDRALTLLEAAELEDEPTKRPIRATLRLAKIAQIANNMMCVLMEPLERED